MNLRQKKERLAELKRLAFPSDQELDEIDHLMEEIRLEREEDQPKPIIKQEVIIKKQKRTIFQAIKEHFAEKPVTEEELNELRKKAIKERLKADIRISKQKGRSSGRGNALNDLFGPATSSKRTSSRTKFSYEDSKEKLALRKKTLGY